MGILHDSLDTPGVPLERESPRRDFAICERAVQGQSAARFARTHSRRDRIALAGRAEAISSIARVPSLTLCPSHPYN
jgi:hypothetical protein